MKKFLVFIVLAISSIGCHENVEKPKDLISEKDIVETLVDIYLHQQPSYMNEIPSIEWNPSETDAQIIKNHGFEIENFKESYRYYVLHPEIFTQILIDVRKQLEDMLPEEERDKREANRRTEGKEVK